MTIKNGSKVTLDYEGKLEDGTVFDSSKHGDHSHPLEFEIGAKQVIPGFEKAVMGLKKGEEKEFFLSPEEAYGNHNPELKKEIPKDVLPKDQEPKVGMGLMLAAPTGQQIPGQIIAVDKDKITVDLNHPLAGKKLTFNIKVIEVK